MSTHAPARPATRCFAALLIGTAVLALPACAPTQQSQPATPAGLLSGRYIAVLGDADMNAQPAGPLFRRDDRDDLTILPLPITGLGDDAPASAPGATGGGTSTPRWSTRLAQARASSSALGPPGALAITPDGTRAYVVEAFTPVGQPLVPAPAGPAAPAAVLPGEALTPIDLTDPSSPRALMPVLVGLSPQSADVHPSGQYVAVASTEPGQQIVILTVGDEATRPLAWPLLGVNLDEPVAVGTIAWHPTGRYLALTLPELDQLVLFEFAKDKASGLPSIAPWGDPLRVPATPSNIRFTPDGRHLLVTSINAPRGALSGALPAGALSVVRLSTVPSETTAAGAPMGSLVEHAVVASVPVGPLPEGLAVSPTGDLVVVASYRGPSLFAGAAVAQGGGLFAFHLDHSTGALSIAATRQLTGVPTSLAFDARGEHLIVAQLRSADPTAIDGELAFYRVVTQRPQPAEASPPVTRLEPLDFAVGVGPGPHALIVR
jgi:DNA-binding beta-propeller fold protein YncE